MEHHLDLRLPHRRGRSHARAGAGLHAGQCHRVRAGGHLRRTGRRRVRSEAVVLLRGPDHRARGGGQVPGRAPAVGPDHARAVRRPRPEVDETAVPYPDGWCGARPPSSRRSTWSVSPWPRWPPCSAAPSRSTPTPSTRPWDCPPITAARLAVRTQQVLAHETDLPEIVDPLGGSFAIERLTDEIEEQVTALIAEIEKHGRSCRGHRCRASSSPRSSETPTASPRRSPRGERVVVGVNAYTTDEDETYQPLRIDREVEGDQVDRLKRMRDRRDGEAVATALEAVGERRRGARSMSCTR